MIDQAKRCFDQKEENQNPGMETKKKKYQHTNIGG